MPKSMILGCGTAVALRDQDVPGLQIAVDDALLVGVLDARRKRDRNRSMRSVDRSACTRSAVLASALSPGHVLHDEVRETGRGDAAVVDLRDVGVVHHRERLTLGLESGHARQLAARSDRRIVLSATLRRTGSSCSGEIDGAHAALTELLDAACSVRCALPAAPFAPEELPVVARCRAGSSACARCPASGAHGRAPAGPSSSVPQCAIEEGLALAHAGARTACVE